MWTSLAANRPRTKKFRSSLLWPIQLRRHPKHFIIRLSQADTSVSVNWLKPVLCHLWSEILPRVALSLNKVHAASPIERDLEQLSSLCWPCADPATGLRRKSVAPCASPICTNYSHSRGSTNNCRGLLCSLLLGCAVTHNSHSRGDTDKCRGIALLTAARHLNHHSPIRTHPLLLRIPLWSPEPLVHCHLNWSWLHYTSWAQRNTSIDPRSDVYSCILYML